MNDDSRSLLKRLAASALPRQLWALAADLGAAACTVPQHRTLPEAAAAAARMAQGDATRIDSIWFNAFGTVFEHPIDAAEDMLEAALPVLGDPAAMALIERHFGEHSKP